MTSIPSCSSNITPTTDNIQMDKILTQRAEQVPGTHTSPGSRFALPMRLEKASGGAEKKGGGGRGAMDSGNGGGCKRGRGDFGEGKAAQLQVSTKNSFWNLTCINSVTQRLEVLVMPEPLLAPFPIRAKR